MVYFDVSNSHVGSVKQSHPARVAAHLAALRVLSLAGLISLIGVMSVIMGCDHKRAEPHVDADKPRSALEVVATIGMIGDVVREVGGDRVSVITLMGEGVDPHMYKASPGDVRAMSEASVIFYNGLHLEGRMEDALHSLSKSRPNGVIEVTRQIDRALLRKPPEFDGQYDPHVWFDVLMWKSAAATIHAALVEHVPARAEEIRARARGYDTVLDELDAYAKASLATVPNDQRVLVTAHDAFGYFGRAYGLEVLAIQGISTDSEASLQDINALVDTLVQRRIPAVFVESSVARKTVDALVEGCKGRGHSVIIGGELFSDAMGKHGTLEGTYVGMVLHNIRTITRALGGTVPEIHGGALRDYLMRFQGRGEDGTTHDG